MTQDLHTDALAPRLAFLGFCERAETVTEGHVVFWKMNILGVSNSRAFYIFPTNLRGLTLALGIFQPRIGESFKLVFRGAQGQPPFDITFQLASAVRTDIGSDSVVLETALTAAASAPDWQFLTNEINVDIFVSSAGIYEVLLASGDRERRVGTINLVHLPVAPYSPAEITALKSDPLATKFVRMNLACSSCHEEMKIYAGVEKSPSLESEGFRWNLDIKEDEAFVCSCGKSRISLIPIKTGLHGLLRRHLDPQTRTDISPVRLYEKTALEEYCRQLLALISANTVEEDLQKFLESHPIFFHIFLPKKIVFKPPILTKFFADFAVLNGRDELLLIEIEKPHLKMLKRDGGSTAELEHAFHQVRTWKQVLDDHRAAALDAIGLKLDEVAKVKGIVVAGRRPSDEKNLRMLRSLSNSEIELFTYDDLLKAVTELIRHVANI